jgi:uncharacterized coiled-coil protein SlyX
MLTGIISPEEFEKFTAFQQQIGDDPAIKELNAKIAVLHKELLQLQAEARAVREKLISANPEMKVIRDKIMSAGHARTGTTPNSMPLPTPAN